MMKSLFMVAILTLLQTSPSHEFGFEAATEHMEAELIGADDGKQIKVS